MTAATPDDLILGAAVGYDAARLRPFLRSLAGTGYPGRVALLVDSRLDAEDRRLLEDQGVDLLAFESWRLSRACVHLARYARYAEVLADRDCNRVMLTDTRDVVFQGDPFALELADAADVAFFLEEPKPTLGECPWNARWVKEAFGAQALAPLFTRTISCSGITVGRRAGVRRYLAAMLDLAQEALPAGLLVEGIDQGLHNVLIHSGRLDGFRLVPNREHVNTMGYLPADAVRPGDDGLIHNADGTVSPVLHQYDYDTHAAVRDAVLARYS